MSTLDENEPWFLYIFGGIPPIVMIWYSLPIRVASQLNSRLGFMNPGLTLQGETPPVSWFMISNNNSYLRFCLKIEPEIRWLIIIFIHVPIKNMEKMPFGGGISRQTKPDFHSWTREFSENVRLPGGLTLCFWSRLVSGNPQWWFFLGDGGMVGWWDGIQNLTKTFRARFLGGFGWLQLNSTPTVVKKQNVATKGVGDHLTM